MTLGSKVVLSDQVLTQQVGDEIVILDLSGEAYFGLDAVGARIWQLIESGTHVEDIVNALVREYDVSAERAKADLDGLIAALASHKLAKVEPA